MKKSVDASRLTKRVAATSGIAAALFIAAPVAIAAADDGTDSGSEISSPTGDSESSGDGSTPDSADSGDGATPDSGDGSSPEPAGPDDAPESDGASSSSGNPGSAESAESTTVDDPTGHGIVEDAPADESTVAEPVPSGSVDDENRHQGFTGTPVEYAWRPPATNQAEPPASNRSRDVSAPMGDGPTPSIPSTPGLFREPAPFAVTLDAAAVTGSSIMGGVADVAHVRPTPGSSLGRLPNFESFAGLLLVSQGTALLGTFNRRDGNDQPGWAPATTSLFLEAAADAGTVVPTSNIAERTTATTYPVGGDSSAPLPTVDDTNPLYDYYFFKVRDPDGAYWPTPATVEEYLNVSNTKTEIFNPQTGEYEVGFPRARPGMAPSFSDPGPDADHYVYTNTTDSSVFVYGGNRDVQKSGRNAWSQVLQPGESIAIAKPTRLGSQTAVIVFKPHEGDTVIIAEIQYFDLTAAGVPVLEYDPGQRHTFTYGDTEGPEDPAGPSVPDGPDNPIDPNEPSNPGGSAGSGGKTLSGFYDRFLNPKTGAFAQIANYANAAVEVIFDDGPLRGLPKVLGHAVGVFGAFTSIIEYNEGVEDQRKGRLVSGTLKTTAATLGVAAFAGSVAVGVAVGFGVTVGAPVVAAVAAIGVAAAAVSGAAWLVKSFTQW